MMTTRLLTALGVTLSLSAFASPALAVPKTAPNPANSAITEQILSIHIEPSAQSKCDQQGCRFVAPKIYCEQEEPGAPVHCVTSPEAIQVAKSSYWYTQRSCQFHPSGGRRTPQETEACRRQRAQQGPPIRFCRDQQRRGPVPCGPNQ